MKSVVKRLWHICLLAAGIVIPIVAALQDAAGELGQLGKYGIVAVGLIAVATNVSHAWKPPASSIYRRVFAVVGTVTGFAGPVLAAIYTKIPSTTKGYLFIGTVAALMASLKGVLGSSAAGAQPEAAQPAVADKVPDGGKNQ